LYAKPACEKEKEGPFPDARRIVARVEARGKPIFWGESLKLKKHVQSLEKRSKSQGKGSC